MPSHFRLQELLNSMTDIRDTRKMQSKPDIPLFYFKASATFGIVVGCNGDTTTVGSVDQYLFFLIKIMLANISTLPIKPVFVLL